VEGWPKSRTNPRDSENGRARISFICPSATVSHTPWIDAKPVSPWPPPHAGDPLSTVAHPGVSGLEGSGVRMRDGDIARRMRPILVAAR